MSEENTPVEGIESAENTATPESTTDAQSENTDGLMGVEATPDTKSAKDSDGLDPELYDTQTKEFRKEVAIEKLAEYKKQTESLEKQVKDFRRIVSKGKAPEDVADYKTYEADSKYAKYWDFNEDANPEVKEISDQLDEVSQKLGFNVEQNKQMKDFLNSVMEKAGVFDTRTPEQIELEQKDWKNAQLKLLGDNAPTVISSVKDFVVSNNLFSEDEKKALLASADKDANVIKAIHKMKRLFRGQDQVPLDGAETTGVPDSMTLAREYNHKDTTPERRMEILKTHRRVYGKSLPAITK
jgi:hypothetical protein